MTGGWPAGRCRRAVAGSGCRGDGADAVARWRRCGGAMASLLGGGRGAEGQGGAGSGRGRGGRLCGPMRPPSTTRPPPAAHRSPPTAPPLAASPPTTPSAPLSPPVRPLLLSFAAALASFGFMAPPAPPKRLLPRAAPTRRGLAAWLWAGVAGVIALQAFTARLPQRGFLDAALHGERFHSEASTVRLPQLGLGRPARISLASRSPPGRPLARRPRLAIGEASLAYPPRPWATPLPCGPCGATGPMQYSSTMLPWAQSRIAECRTCNAHAVRLCCHHALGEPRSLPLALGVCGFVGALKRLSK